MRAVIRRAPVSPRQASKRHQTPAISTPHRPQVHSVSTRRDVDTNFVFVPNSRMFHEAFRAILLAGGTTNSPPNYQRTPHTSIHPRPIQPSPRCPRATHMRPTSLVLWRVSVRRVRANDSQQTPAISTQHRPQVHSVSTRRDVDNNFVFVPNCHNHVASRCTTWAAHEAVSISALCQVRPLEPVCASRPH